MRRILLSLVLCISGLSVWSQPAVEMEPAAAGESMTAYETVEDITGTVTLLQDEPFRPTGDLMKLSLEDALEVADQMSPQIRIAEHGVEESKANLDLTESNYRNKFDLVLTADERLRRRGGGTFRIDPNLGLVNDNFKSSHNNELFTAGPTYQRTFKNGSSIEISPSFDYEQDTEAEFDRSAGNPDGNRNDERYRIGATYNIPLNSRPREEIRTQIENSKLNTIRSDYDLYLSRKQIRQQVINNYWNIKSLQENLSITNERLLQAKKVEFILQVQYENENAPRVNVDQARIDVMNNEATLIQQEGSLRSAVENFNLLLGIPVETRLELSDPLIAEPLPLAAKDYVEMITSSNLELKDLNISIQQAENNLRIASLGKQPDLVLSTFMNVDDEGTENYGAGLFFAWPVGDGGATSARVRAAQERLEQLRISLWNLERQLAQEAYQDLRNLQLQRQRIGILERNVSQSEVTLDNAQIMFQEFGRLTFREMQDFQIDLANSRNQLVQAMVQYNSAKSSLLQKVHDYSADEFISPLFSVVR